MERRVIIKKSHPDPSPREEGMIRLSHNKDYNNKIIIDYEEMYYYHNSIVIGPYLVSTRIYSPHFGRGTGDKAF
jgi:hypothetical protein